MSRSIHTVTLTLPMLVGAAFSLITATATATFALTQFAYQQSDRADGHSAFDPTQRIMPTAGKPAAKRRADSPAAGGGLTPIALSRTLPPFAIGFFAPARKCSVDPQTGHIALAIIAREPGN